MERGPKIFLIVAAIILVPIGLIAAFSGGGGEPQRPPGSSGDGPQQESKPEQPKGGGAPPNADAKVERIEEPKGGGAPPKPEPKPARDLYHRAHVAQVTKLPAYEVVEVSVNETEFGKRLDMVVVTPYTTDKEALGAVMVDITLDQLDTDTDLLEVAFFDSEAAVAADEIFAYGTLAETAAGKAMITGEQELSKVGKYPVLRITV
jgi:hypothetical protein